MSLRRPTVEEVFINNRGISEQIEYENAFFSNVLLEYNVKKTTYPNRLDDINEALKPLLPAYRPLELMDVAISSGISTLEWSISLKSAGIEHNMVAGDAVINASLISITKLFQVLVASNDYPIQFDILGRAIPSASTRFIVCALRYFLRKMYEAVSLISPCLKDNRMNRYEGRCGIRCRPIKLITRSLTKMQHIEIIEDNIITNRDPILLHRFDAVRAANILNRRCFNSDTLRIILMNIRDRLKNGGLLIECRTDENNVNNGSVFRINHDKHFEIIKRIGKGSELEDFVLKNNDR